MCIILHGGGLHGDYTAYYILWRPILSVLLYTYSHTLPLYLCTTIDVIRQQAHSGSCVAEPHDVPVAMYVVLFVRSTTHCVYL